MKITKRQLRRIIKEEKQRILHEAWGESVETGSELIEFARAYSGLGHAVSSQVDSIVAAFINGGGPGSNAFLDVVYEQNPNAIDMVEQRLSSTLRRLAQEGSEDAESLLDVIEEAQKIFKQGDDEIEADARAAGDR